MTFSKTKLIGPIVLSLGVSVIAQAGPASSQRQEDPPVKISQAPTDVKVSEIPPPPMPAPQPKDRRRTNTLPPPIATAPSDKTQAASARQTKESEFSGRMMVGEEVLWEGRLELKGYSGAEVKIDQRIAPVACDGMSSGIPERVGSALSIQQRWRRENWFFKIRSGWTRLSENCEAPGTLSVMMDLTVPIEVGQTEIYHGDNDFKVELTRLR